MLSGNQRRVSVRKLGIVLIGVVCASVFTDYTDLYGRTKTNDDRARGVLDEALKTLGGVDQLQQLRSISMKGQGKAHASAESQAVPRSIRRHSLAFPRKKNWRSNTARTKAIKNSAGAAGCTMEPSATSRTSSRKENSRAAILQ